MTRKYHVSVAAVTAAAILVSAAPLAAHDCDDHHARAAVPVVFADENRDGKVTRAEAMADPALARNFDQYDRDEDNILDRAEFAQLEAEREHYMEPDSDGTAGFDDRLRPRQVIHQTPP